MSRQPTPLQVVRPAPRSSKVRASAGDSSPSSTQRIVESITTAIVERRLMPGTKLAEQKIADIFKVSRTLVRQALNQLSRDKLVTLEPARGARVAEPSIDEARQVFEVRNMLESAMIRRAATALSDAQLAELRTHLRDEQAAVQRTDVSGRTRLLADFHVVLAAHDGQPGAGRAAGGPGHALLADRADVPVVALGRAFLRGTRGHRRRARAARRQVPPCG